MPVVRQENKKQGNKTGGILHMPGLRQKVRIHVSRGYIDNVDIFGSSYYNKYKNPVFFNYFRRSYYNILHIPCGNDVRKTVSGQEK